MHLLRLPVVYNSAQQWLDASMHVLLFARPLGKETLFFSKVHDEAAMRLAGLRFSVPCITTLRGAQAAISALRSIRAQELRAIKLQELNALRHPVELH